MTSGRALVDHLGRRIDYVRLSVTDRCDLRCHYCMSEQQSFLPKDELLSFEELETLVTFLCARGVKHLRITGGEPLVRKGILPFLETIGQKVVNGQLSELTLTTNGTRLEESVEALKRAQIKRINVSVDSLRPERFHKITRGGDLSKVLRGIDKAKQAGLKIKLNVVVLRHDNLMDIADIISFAHDHGFAISLIETMPMGQDIKHRESQFVSLDEVVQTLSSFWQLLPSSKKTSGPARYFDIVETGGSLGLITPLSHNFCATCNRVRITCTGKLYMCLGQDDHIDLKAAIRQKSPESALNDAFLLAMNTKPKAHDFFIAEPQNDRQSVLTRTVGRTMSVTGG